MKSKKYRKALAEGIRICQELREKGNTYYQQEDLLFQTEMVKNNCNYHYILHQIHLAE